MVRLDGEDDVSRQDAGDLQRRRRSRWNSLTRDKKAESPRAQIAIAVWSVGVSQQFWPCSRWSSQVSRTTRQGQQRGRRRAEMRNDSKMNVSKPPQRRRMPDDYALAQLEERLKLA